MGWGEVGAVQETLGDAKCWESKSKLDKLHVGQPQEMTNFILVESHLSPILVLKEDDILRNTLSSSKLNLVMPIRSCSLCVRHLKSIKLKGLVGFQPTP